MAPNEPDPLKRALKAIALVVFVVVFNLALYVVIDLLVNLGLVGGTIFPALLLFLSFAVSLAIILIVALGEKIETQNINNAWIKKIGVTPILTVVAAIISILLGLSIMTTTL